MFAQLPGAWRHCSSGGQCLPPQFIFLPPQKNTFWKKNEQTKKKKLYLDLVPTPPAPTRSCDSERTSTILCFFVCNMQQQTVRFKAVIVSRDKALSHHRLQQVQGSPEHSSDFASRCLNTCPQPPNNMHVDILSFSMTTVLLILT